MTRLESDIYQAVCCFWEQYKCGPSYDDLRFILQLSHKSVVHRCVIKMCKMGYLKRDPRKARSVRPSKTPPPYERP